MTVTTSIMTRCTTEDNRAKYMGRLQSSTTAGWIFGPSAGALLYKHVDKKAPVLFASSLFVLNLILAVVLLPGTGRDGSKTIFSDLDDDANSVVKKKGPKGG